VHKLIICATDDSGNRWRANVCAFGRVSHIRTNDDGVGLAART